MSLNPLSAAAYTATELIATAMIVPLAVMVMVRLVAERFWPAQPTRPRGDSLNLWVLMLSSSGRVLLGPGLGGATTWAVNLAGGGLITLPAQGSSLAIGVAAYLVAMDFGEYLFHRAQHRWPILWAMHSLHHSDTSFDSTTTVRHFWLDPFLKSLTIWLAVGLMFKTSSEIILIYVLIGQYNYLTHANTRLGLGRASWLWNMPAYHRLHHSASPEHFDCNFAALLPIFDVLFGAYRRPAPGERPQTGLDTGDRPRSLFEAATWPMARLGSRRTAS